MIEVEDMSHEDTDVPNPAGEFAFDDDGRVTIVLRHPIKFGEQVYTELRLRDVKGKDMRTLKSKPDETTGLVMALAGKLAGVPTQVIDELRGADLRKVMNLVGLFMDGSLDAGEPSSEPSP